MLLPEPHITATCESGRELSAVLLFHQSKKKNMLKQTSRALSVHPRLSSHLGLFSREHCLLTFFKILCFRLSWPQFSVCLVFEIVRMLRNAYSPPARNSKRTDIADKCVTQWAITHIKHLDYICIVQFPFLLQCKIHPLSRSKQLNSYCRLFFPPLFCFSRETQAALTHVQNLQDHRRVGQVGLFCTTTGLHIATYFNCQKVFHYFSYWLHSQATSPCKLY